MHGVLETFDFLSKIQLNIKKLMFQFVERAECATKCEDLVKYHITYGRQTVVRHFLQLFDKYAHILQADHQQNLCSLKRYQWAQNDLCSRCDLNTQQAKEGVPKTTQHSTAQPLLCYSRQ